MAIVKTSNLELDLNRGIKTNVEVVDGKLELEVVGEIDVTYEETSVPQMTSNTSPSGSASASSVYNSSYQPYLAFNPDPSLNWVSSSRRGEWISYEFPVKKVIRRYCLTNNKNTGAPPRNWSFEGSNDNQTWDILDTKTGISWDYEERKIFDIINEKPYKIYRVYVNTNNGFDRIVIRYIELIEGTHKYKIYPSHGTIEFPTTDLGSHFREIKSVSSIKNIPEVTNIKIYTSTSNDNITFSDYSLVDSGTGLITSSQGRYIKVKAELIGNSEESARVLNDFDESESSQFITDEQVVFNGGLHLKNEYVDQLVEDTTWTDEGRLFRKSLNKQQFKQIDKVEVG